MTPSTGAASSRVREIDAAPRLTSRPAVRPTGRMPDLRRRAGRLWWEYTRMRTAIVFLIGLVLIVLVGSFVPQQDTSDPGKVSDFLAANPNLNSLASHLGFPLTQVFVSPLFYALLGSLYIALAACVLRRGRALVVRTLRGHRRTPQYWGEWGSWAFHTSFFLLLVAVVWGKATGFEGFVPVVDGQTVTETRASYNQIFEGVLFDRGWWPFDAQHGGYQVRLDHFSATFQPNGQPQDFVSSVTVLDRGRPVQSKDIRVNDFLSYQGIDFYQRDYGWAPRLVVTNPQGRVVYDDPVELFGDDKSQQTGVLKVPSFGYTLPGGSQPVQLGAQVVLYPDARATTSLGPGGSVTGAATSFAAGGQESRNPVVQLQLWVGDLGLASGRPQNVNALDTTGMAPYYNDSRSIPIALGSRVQLPLRGNSCSDPVAAGCFTISFAGVPQYSLFEVKKDAGVPLVYASFALVMTGLLTKLYLRPLLEARQRRRASEGRRADGEAAPPQPGPGGDGAPTPAGAGDRELVGSSSGATSSGGT